MQHLISKFEPVEPAEQKHGSRLAIVFSGSPLFTGGAGSGESDIRKWIIENDWLEGIIALPEQMFYNTGIGTYIWIVTNRKDKRRKGNPRPCKLLYPPRYLVFKCCPVFMLVLSKSFLTHLANALAEAGVSHPVLLRAARKFPTIP